LEIDLLQLLTDSPLLLIFTVLGIGYLVGDIRIFGLPVGPTIGVLVVGLVFGHFGLSIAPMVGTFGFALFIFCADGPSYLVLSLIVAATGLGLVLLLAQLADLAPGYDAGLFAGALTSTPSLAGARDAFASGLGDLGEVTVAAAMQNVSVGYAISYLGGTLGIIAMVRYAPRFAGIDLAKAAAALERERGMSGKRQRTASHQGLPVIRAYKVQKVAAGKTLDQRRKEIAATIVPLRVKRGDDFLEPRADLEIFENDVISILANIDVHREIQQRVGKEVLDSTLLNYEVLTRDIIVLRKEAVGQPVDLQAAVARHGCFVTALTRAGIELPLSDKLELNRGDRLTVTGERSHLEEAARQLGHIEEEIEETDLVAFSFGIATGLLLGILTVKIGTVSIGLGMAGGLLISGIVIGSASSVNPTFGRVPRPARYLLRELGLMLFMAQVGLNAGGGIVEALASVGPVMIGLGLLVTLVPAIVAFLIGFKLLKLNPALLLGSVSGAMTSTPALNVLSELARSPVPALGYAGTYTIANVLLTFAGALIAAL
jgi:putative transport protein